MRREDVLLEMYKAQVSRSEHYETQRSLVSNHVVAISAALVALTTFDRQLSPTDIPLAALMFLLGSFGIFASLLHHDRSRRHGKTAEAYRIQLDKVMPSAKINETRINAHDAVILKHGKRFLRLHHLWIGLHACIALLGTVILALACTQL